MLSSLCTRTRGVKAEVSSLLVQVCSHIPDLGMLSKVDEDKEESSSGRDGPICWPRHHHMHCPKHHVHGHGTSTHGSQFLQNALCGELREWRAFACSFKIFIANTHGLFILIQDLSFYFYFRCSPPYSLLRWSSSSSLWTRTTISNKDGTFSTA